MVLGDVAAVQGGMKAFANIAFIDMWNKFMPPVLRLFILLI